MTFLGCHEARKEASHRTLMGQPGDRNLDKSQDLLPGNLLVHKGRISAVIDFGCLGVGDPACDLIVAWALLSAQTRNMFRAALSVDDATWGRGRGWALSIGLIALPYYQHTNPVFAATASRMIAEVLADHEHAP